MRASGRRVAARAGAALGLGAAAGAAALAWGAGVELRTFRLRRATAPVLPAGAPDLRVLHLSDLHLLPRQGRKRDFVRALDRLDPHLVVNTGDNIAAADALPALVDTLGPLLARPGCFVFGSNDFSAPHPANPVTYLLPDSMRPERRHDDDLPAGEVRRLFTAAGWLDLDNASGTLVAAGPDLGPTGRVEVAVTGTGDAHIDRDDLSTIGPAPAGVPAFAVTHAPYRRVLDAFTGAGWPLVFAGHTHGGQLRIPGHGAIVSNCDLPPAQASGLSRWPPAPELAGPMAEAPGPEQAYLHVSAGLGTSPWAPVRIACLPEATLLTLTAGGSGPGRRVR